MNHGSLFTGIGGFDLGFDSAGFESAWQVEIDLNCRAVLERHWPDVRRHEDVAKVGSDCLQHVAVISGGFPCQDLSVAGKRGGLAGKRSGLFFEAARVIGEVRPEWIVIENVPGLLSSNKGEDFIIVLEALTKLRYGVAWRVLDSQYFGVAQRRRRVFIVGCLGDGRSAAEVLFEPESLCGDPAPSRETGERVAASLTRGAESSGRGGYAGRRREDDVNLVASPITASAGHHGHSSPRGDGSDNLVAAHETGQGWWKEDEKAGTLRAEGENRPSRPSHIVANALSSCGVGTCGADDNQAQGRHLVAAPLTSNPYADNEAQDEKLVVEGYPCVAFTQNQQGDVLTGEMMHAISTNQNATGRNSAKINQGMTVRRLTPMECERLQGFPDQFTEGVSDSARYRMLGNAVTVPVAEWIAKRIAAHI